MLRAPKIQFRSWKTDVPAGVIVGLVSIPISMGYAQIAGLPPVYGLYGSLLPILCFGLLTSSPQFVVGVDAMPAVMVGNALTVMGLRLGSPEAAGLVPVISLLTALWFVVFYLFRAGRVVKYISQPVMGGFISGIGATIILMQIPKLFGGDPGTGELFALLGHLVGQLGSFHALSALLGFGTVAVILISKKLAPQFPMSVLMLALGVVLTAVFHIDCLGVKLLPAVPGGLPHILWPELRLAAGHLTDLLVLSLSIALVVMAQTLLASSNYATKYRYQIDNRQELLAYAAAELAGALVGCCPINGSVSRSGIADQFRCKSQLMSLTAALTMLLVLLFGAQFLSLLPVPILTGIVVAALIGILELNMAAKLWRCNRSEFFIFLTAFFGVLLFGTIYGVVIGVVLSFFAVVIRAVVPPRALLGVIPGHEDLYDLRRNRSARPIRNTVVYRFSGNLFFANIGTFESDLESAIRPDTRQIIVDGRGVGNIDITAAERLVLLEKSLKARGIRLYLTEHVGAVNDQLRRYGAGELLETGVVRRTVALALRDAGLEAPYPLEGTDAGGKRNTRDESESFAEFEWLYGEQSEEKLEQLALVLAREIARSGVSLEEAERRSGWGRVGLFDENELVDYVEAELEEMAREGAFSEEKLQQMELELEQTRPSVEADIGKLPPGTQEFMRGHRERLRQRLKARREHRRDT